MSMKKISLALILSFVILIASPVMATITISVTAPSSVTQGSNAPIIASFVASEGDSGTFYFTCDQTVSGEVDPEDGYSVVSSTSKTYTFTPSNAQSYSNCKVSDGGTQSSSTFPINVIAPSTLTVSGSPSSTSNSSSDTYPLSISITNPTDSSVTTSYSLSCPSGYSCSGDQEEDTITISAGATTTLEWTVTVGSSSADVTFQLGSNSDAFTSSVTVPSTTTTTSGGGGSGGGSGATGGSTSSTTGQIVKIWSILHIDTPVTWEINQSNIAITQVDIKVKNELRVPKLTINNISTRPSSVSQVSGSVYQYLNITPQNIQNSDLESVKLEFRVERDWLIANNIDENSVSLNRYSNGNWNKLDTNRLSGDSTYVYYQADIPGFSIFVVTGESATGAGEQGVTTTTSGEQSVTTTVPKTRLVSPNKLKRTFVLAIVALVIVVTLVIVLGSRNRETKEIKKEDLEDKKKKESKP